MEGSSGHSALEPYPLDFGFFIVNLMIERAKDVNSDYAIQHIAQISMDRTEQSMNVFFCRWVQMGNKAKPGSGNDAE